MGTNHRADNWKNAVTGLGSALRDKVRHTQFSASQTFSDETLESLYHNDDMAARVCDVVPDEMLRQGFEIVDMSRSVARAVLLDAEDEDFHRDTYSFAGVPQILEKMMLRLAAAARMPVSLLMGQAPLGVRYKASSMRNLLFSSVSWSFLTQFLNKLPIELTAGWPQRITPPGLPQIRTCGTTASGSSD